MLVVLASLSLLAVVHPSDTDSSRYKMTVTSYQRAKIDTLTQVQETTVTGFLTLVTRDTAGGQVAEFRVDSLKLAPNKTTPANYQGNTALAKGLVFKGYVRLGQSRGGFKISAPNPQAELLGLGLDNLFPGFKPLVKAGDTWSDTTKVSAAAPVVMDQTTIADWKVTSLTDGLIVADAVMSGSSLRRGTTPKGPQEIAGTMTGKRHMTGPVAGPMTTVTISSEQPLTSTTGAAKPIAILGRTSITITRLP